jgi:hypothetical protein
LDTQNLACHTGRLHLKGKQTSLTTWGFLSTPISFIDATYFI